MERRDFLKLAGAGAAGALVLGACSTSDDDGDGQVVTTGDANLDSALQADDLPEFNWEMATSWPGSPDTIFGGAEVFADRVTKMTGGRFKMTAKAGGELVPRFDILPSVQNGTVQAGHTASYYYLGMAQVTAFGTALPFGLTARQQNAWLYEGGGLDMMQDIYRERFGVIQFPAGNTGVQMGGWFNREIRSLSDLEGLRMRIPGLGGQVMEKLGVTVQVLPGSDIFQALQTNAIDAAEWVGPHDDAKLDFQSVSDFYYFPGWWEPGPSLEVQLPVDAWDGLPEEYKAVIETAAKQANVDMMATYDALNPPALAEIVDSGDVQILPFPEDVMRAAEDASFELFEENAAADNDFRSVLDNWTAFRSGIRAWHSLAEATYLAYESQR